MVRRCPTPCHTPGERLVPGVTSLDEHQEEIIMKVRSVRLLTALALPLVLGAAACEESPAAPPAAGEDDLRPGYALLGDDSEVALEVDADRFEAGADVALALTNHSDETVGYNLCVHSLETRSDGEWTRVEGVEQNQVCTMQLHLLEPGEEAGYQTVLPSALPEGEYRYRVAVHFMDREEHRDQVSATFEVEG